MLSVYHQSFVYTILKYCVDSECYNSTHLDNSMYICVAITLYSEDINYILLDNFTLIVGKPYNFICVCIHHDL